MTFLPIDRPMPTALRAAKLRGVHLAIVTDNKDGEGNPGYRVKVKFPWLNDQETTYWARIAMPMGGNDRGTYFLPEADDQLLVVFEHGDIDRPIVIGALWSKKQEVVEVNANGKNDVKLIKSRAGHRIIFDDKDGAEKLTIVDKTKKNKIVLDSANKVVTIECAGDIEIKAKAMAVIHANALKIGTSDTLTGSGQQVLTHTASTFGLKASGKITISGSQVEVNVSSSAATSVSGSGAGELGAIAAEAALEQIKEAAGSGGGGGGGGGGAGGGPAPSGPASVLPPNPPPSIGTSGSSGGAGGPSAGTSTGAGAGAGSASAGGGAGAQAGGTAGAGTSTGAGAGAGSASAGGGAGAQAGGTAGATTSAGASAGAGAGPGSASAGGGAGAQAGGTAGATTSAGATSSAQAGGSANAGGGAGAQAGGTAGATTSAGGGGSAQAGGSANAGGGAGAQAGGKADAGAGAGASGGAQAGGSAAAGGGAGAQAGGSAAAGGGAGAQAGGKADAGASAGASGGAQAGGSAKGGAEASAGGSAQGGAATGASGGAAGATGGAQVGGATKGGAAGQAGGVAGSSESTGATGGASAGASARVAGGKTGEPSLGGAPSAPSAGAAGAGAPSADAPSVSGHVSHGPGAPGASGAPGAPSADFAGSVSVGGAPSAPDAPSAPSGATFTAVPQAQAPTGDVPTAPSVGSMSMPSGAPTGDADLQVSRTGQGVPNDLESASNVDAEVSGKAGEAGVYRATGPDGQAIARGGAQGTLTNKVADQTYDPSVEVAGSAHRDQLSAIDSSDKAEERAIEHSGYKDPRGEVDRAENLEGIERDRFSARADVTDGRAGEVRGVVDDPKARAMAEAGSSGETLARDHAPVDPRAAQAKVNVASEAIHNPETAGEGQVEAEIKSHATVQETRTGVSGDVTIKPGDKK
jgi:hypothetical protein